jgi:lipopolysaccharide export system ATP-binding protein
MEGGKQNQIDIPANGKGILHTDGLVKIYQRRRVVNEVTIQIQKGEIVGLLGPNGAGKTTTFYMLVGLIRPNVGQIFLNEENITEMPMYMRAKKGISYLPQEPSIFRKMTVEENILSIMETMSISAQERFKRTDELLTELNLQYVRKNKGYNLSGGERRRVEIARSLVLSPSFMLLDEPFAGIDPLAVSDLQKIIKLLKDKGIGILITDHNVRETLKITDRAYIITEGVIFRSGTPIQLANDEQVRTKYLGKEFQL